MMCAAFASPRRRPPARGRRGVALLLVMIGLVVCMILAAGFLATQGTSIGIARNERDAAKCRDAAQSGVDMCFWLIRNKSDWRETMTPGTWLASYSVGDATVTVTAADGDNSGNFADDPTQAVILTSTGAYDSRSYTLTATIRPTGGGTVFSAGNFVNGAVLLGNNDLVTVSVIDSYNSSVAPYNPLAPGSNAAFGTNATSNGLTIYSPSIYRGSYTSGVGSSGPSLISVIGAAAITPSSISTALEARIPGSAYPPNTTGLAARGVFSVSSGTTGMPGPGNYNSITASSTGTANIASNGTYYCSGNLSISSLATLSLAANVTAALVVNGNSSISGKITLGSGASLTIYANNTVTVSGGSINNNGNTGRLTLIGLPNCTQITLSGAGNLTGAVFAPQAAVTMQSGSTKLSGALIAKSLSLSSTGQLHFDENLRSARFSNITGGSAPPGAADYAIAITGGPGIH